MVFGAENGGPSAVDDGSSCLVDAEFLDDGLEGGFVGEGEILQV